MAGQASMMRLIFSAITTLATTFLLYFREPVGLALDDNKRSLSIRQKAFMRSLKDQYYGEVGREFDVLADTPTSQLSAAGD